MSNTGPIRGLSQPTSPNGKAAPSRVVAAPSVQGMQSSEEARGHTRCPRCQHDCQAKVVCPQCGLFLGLRQTGKIGTIVPHATVKKPVGDVRLEKQQAITFELNGAFLTLPIAQMLVIGRSSQWPNDPQPDVSLSAFAADTLGVSRHHIQLLRWEDVVYVTDLGSRNGTLLNGRPLLCHCQRLLRNGDELRLGYLVITVRF